MRKSGFIALIMGLVFVLTSCGTGRTMVSDPVIVPSSARLRGITIERGEDTIPVSYKAKSVFENRLSRKLFADGNLRRGSGIYLQYRFIQFDEGSRFARYMFGGIGNMGESSLMIEVSYLDENGRNLGRIQTEGRISSGIFGGSSDEAVERAADEVANYTRNLMMRR